MLKKGQTLISLYTVNAKCTCELLPIEITIHLILTMKEKVSISIYTLVVNSEPDVQIIDHKPITELRFPI